MSNGAGQDLLEKSSAKESSSAFLCRRGTKASALIVSDDAKQHLRDDLCVRTTVCPSFHTFLSLYTGLQALLSGCTSAECRGHVRTI